MSYISISCQVNKLEYKFVFVMPRVMSALNELGAYLEVTSPCTDFGDGGQDVAGGGGGKCFHKIHTRPCKTNVHTIHLQLSNSHATS